MNHKRAALAILFLLGILTICGVALYYGAAFLNRRVTALGETTITLGVFAALIVLLAARMIFEGPRRAARLQIEESRRAVRQTAYGRLLAAMYRSQGELESIRSARETMSHLLDAEAELLLVGSPEVIRCWMELHRRLDQSDDESELSIHDLVLAMRDDLGCGSDGLTGANGEDLLPGCTIPPPAEENHQAPRQRPAATPVTSQA